MSNFGFLQPEWPEIFESATKAEGLVYPDARTACFYAGALWSLLSIGFTSTTAH
jgi:hypothetical protein